MSSGKFFNHAFECTFTDFHIENILVNMTADISPIEGEYAEITIPFKEVLEGLQVGTDVRIASLLLRNMSGLLPRSFGGANEDSSLRSDRKKAKL